MKKNVGGLFMVIIFVLAIMTNGAAAMQYQWVQENAYSWGDNDTNNISL